MVWIEWCWYGGWVGRGLGLMGLLSWTKVTRSSEKPFYVKRRFAEPGGKWSRICLAVLNAQWHAVLCCDVMCWLITDGVVVE